MYPRQHPNLAVRLPDDKKLGRAFFVIAYRIGGINRIHLGSNNRLSVAKRCLPIEVIWLQAKPITGEITAHES